MDNYTYDRIEQIENLAEGKKDNKWAKVSMLIKEIWAHKEDTDVYEKNHEDFQRVL